MQCCTSRVTKFLATDLQQYYCACTLVWNICLEMCVSLLQCTALCCTAQHHRSDEWDLQYGIRMCVGGNGSWTGAFIGGIALMNSFGYIIRPGGEVYRDAFVFSRCCTCCCRSSCTPQDSRLSVHSMPCGNHSAALHCLQCHQSHHYDQACRHCRQAVTVTGWLLCTPINQHALTARSNWTPLCCVTQQPCQQRRQEGQHQLCVEVNQP